jgi:hypothetical protein
VRKLFKNAEEIYRVFQVESAILQENLPCVKLYRYNKTYPTRSWTFYVDDVEILFKECK